MRKFSLNKLVVFVMLCTVALLTACSSDGNGESGKKDEDDKISIDMSLFYTENDAFSQSFIKWAELVEEETEGRVVFNPHYSASLVSLFDTMDAVRNGSVDAGVLSAGAISGEIPAMGLLEVLGTFQKEEQFKSQYEEVTLLLSDILAQENLKLLFWSPGSTDVLALHNKKMLKEVDQFKDLKMRTAGRWQSEQIQRLGASPVSMDPSELYLALQNGTVDSTIQAVSLANSQKLYEVTPKMVSLGSSSNVIPYVVNQDIWDEITPEDQEIIEKVSKQVGEATYSDLSQKEQEAIENMEKEGAEIYSLSSNEQEAFQKIFRSVWDEIAKTAGEDGQKLLEVLKNDE
ncbi:TRAP transporter substrate-binding protein [Sporosarcina obsidiansis]|uniref:TRAP transporter substrate-binding protein n=1 Tax=Sporosarcina obsidiansis TaxID=2660748 RepID=UPI001891C24C|nr:TRAP transporter substrate-binding protein [Sporosarcina obsidiansis]